MNSQSYQWGEGNEYLSLDYTRCQRPDGTYYGTGGVCRKGTQVEAPETKAAKGHEKANQKFMSALQSSLGDDTTLSTKDGEIIMETKTRYGDSVKIDFSLQEGYNFSVNGSWDAGTVTGRREQMAVALKVKDNFDKVKSALPTGTVLMTRAWAGDGMAQYQARVKAYERMGFGPPKSLGGEMYSKKMKNGEMKRSTALGYNTNKKKSDAVFFSESKKDKEALALWMVAIFGARVKESEDV